MLMLLPPAVGRVSTSVVLSGGGGGSFASTLADRITQGGLAHDGGGDSCTVLSSPVLDSWDGLKDVSLLRCVGFRSVLSACSSKVEACTH